MRHIIILQIKIGEIYFPLAHIKLTETNVTSIETPIIT